MQNKGKEISIPKILEKHRTSLKFINAAFKKHLLLFKMHKIVLDVEPLKKDECKKEKDSLPSANESNSDLSSTSN